MDPIQFTGEFDSAEITKGIDAMISAMERAVVKEKDLGKSIEFTDQVRKESEEGIKKLQATIAGLDKTSKDYAATNATLESRLKALTSQYDKYTDTIESQRKEMLLLQASNEKMKKSYEDATKAVENLQKTAGKGIAPAINDTKITQQIGGIVDKAKGVGEAIVGSFNSSASAVDNVSNSISSLGGLFGPVGIAAGAALAIIAKGLFEIVTAETEAAKTTKLLNESLKATARASAEASSDVDILKIKFNLAKEGLLEKDEVLKEYNETLGKTLGVTKDFNEAEQLLLDNAEAYIKIVGLKAQAQALANIKIAESEKKAKALLGFDDNRNVATKVADFFSGGSLGSLIPGNLNSQAQDAVKSTQNAIASRQRFNNEITAEADARIKIISEEELKVQRAIAELSLPFKDNPKKFDKTKADRARQEVVNIYEQELQKLLSDIAKLDSKTFTDESTITKAVEASFKKREIALDKAFKKGQLTSSQLGSLKSNLSQLQDLTLNRELKEFGEKRAAFQQKIEDTITSVQLEESLKRVSLIKDDYERQRQTIEIESTKTTEALIKKRDKVIDDLRKNASKNGFTDQAIEVEVTKITDAYSKLLEDIENIKQQKLQKLSFDTFEQLASDANRTFNQQSNRLSSGGLLQLREQNELYTTGQITYKQYQKALTKIAKDEANARFEIEKSRLTLQIRLRVARLATDKTLTDNQVKQLEDEIDKLKRQLNEAEKGNETISPSEEDKSSKRINKLNKLNSYVIAISGLINEVIGFWAAMNEAEAKALDRSIALQERRVDSARRLAERGNAEYLRLEEDRMKDLEVKRENNARRQLAINAALQASQVVTALISGISYGAQQGGALGAIAGLAAIVAAIAGGYAIVKSLQPDQPTFFEGSEDTGPGGNADDKKGFHAILHPHERVLTREQNKKLKGLSNEELINVVEKSRFFVEYNYPSKMLPQPNLNAIEMANSVSSTQSLRIAGIMEDNNRKLDENNTLQKKILKTLTGLGMSVSMDRNGFAASFMESVDQINKAKKT